MRRWVVEMERGIFSHRNFNLQRDELFTRDIHFNEPRSIFLANWRNRWYEDVEAKDLCGSSSWRWSFYVRRVGAWGGVVLMWWCPHQGKLSMCVSREMFDYGWCWFFRWVLFARCQFGTKKSKWKIFVSERSKSENVELDWFFDLNLCHVVEWEDLKFHKRCTKWWNSFLPAVRRREPCFWIQDFISFTWWCSYFDPSSLALNALWTRFELFSVCVVLSKSHHGFVDFFRNWAGWC